jgi:ketosteroid isomerase-like protein
VVHALASVSALGQGPSTEPARDREEQQAQGEVEALAKEFLAAFGADDLSRMTVMYVPEPWADYTKRNHEYFRSVLERTGDVQVREFKINSTHAIGTSASVYGEVRLSAKETATGREFFPAYPIRCYVGLDRGFSSPWRIRVFLVEVDATAMERNLRAFYEGFAEKDEEKIMAVWTGRLTDEGAAAKRQVIRKMFRETGRIELASFAFEDADIDGDKATAHVHVLLKANVADGSEPYFAAEPMDLDWQMVREKDGWRALGFGLHKESVPSF